jgi:hypothetical protein
LFHVDHSSHGQRSSRTGHHDPERMAETLTADKGYFSREEIGRLQELTLKTVISDRRRDQRHFDKHSSAHAKRWRERSVR